MQIMIQWLFFFFGIVSDNLSHMNGRTDKSFSPVEHWLPLHPDMREWARPSSSQFLSEEQQIIISSFESLALFWFRISDLNLREQRFPLLSKNSTILHHCPLSIPPAKKAFFKKKSCKEEDAWKQDHLTSIQPHQGAILRHGCLDSFWPGRPQCSPGPLDPLSLSFVLGRLWLLQAFGFLRCQMRVLFQRSASWPN